MGPMADTHAWDQLAASNESVDDRVLAWYSSARESLRSLTPGAKNNNIEEATCQWKPAVGEIAKIEPGSCWRSDGWRVLSKKYSEIMNLVHRRRRPEWDWAIIQNLKRNAGKLVASARKPEDGKELMQAWLDEADAAVNEGDTARLGTLLTVAANFAKEAETETLKRDSEKWKEWAGSGKNTSSGKAIPSKQAYQWARCPAGWTQPVLDMASKEDDVPDDNALSFDDLPSELAHENGIRAGEQHADVMVPLGPQAEVDVTANTWALLWKEYEEYLVAISPDDTSMLDLLTADDIFYAAMSFPMDTGLGADNFAPRAIARLPRKALQVLADLLNEMERQGKWAQCLSLGLLALIQMRTAVVMSPIGLLPPSLLGISAMRTKLRH